MFNTYIHHKILNERLAVAKQLGELVKVEYLIQKKKTPRYKYLIIENNEYFFFHYIYNASKLASPSKPISFIESITDGCLFLFDSKDNPTIKNIHFYFNIKDIPNKYSENFTENIIYTSKIHPKYK